MTIEKLNLSSYLAICVKEYLRILLRIQLTCQYVCKRQLTPMPVLKAVVLGASPMFRLGSGDVVIPPKLCIVLRLAISLCAAINGYKSVYQVFQHSTKKLHI